MAVGLGTAMASSVELVVVGGGVAFDALVAANGNPPAVSVPAVEGGVTACVGIRSSGVTVRVG